MRMRNPVLALSLLMSLWSACAPRIVPAPVITTPRYPDYIQPAVPAALAGTEAANHHDRAWRFLQAGDLRNAERETAVALKMSSAFYPAETTSGYVALARAEPRAALGHFDRALGEQPNYVAALAGRGHALLELNREEDAVAAFEAALVIEPALTDLRRRVDVLRFRGLERDIAAARRAAQAGQADEAIRYYNSALAASPDSPFLYRELARVERDRGDLERALEHFRRAASLDPSDAVSLAQIAELLETRGELDEAVRTYDAALAVDRLPEVEARRDALLERMKLALLPAEYRAIPTADTVTRADLAALIGVRFAPALEARRTREAAVLTDVRTSWAEPWIMSVAGAGVMEPYANHTFQPRNVVRRVDLAEAVVRLLAFIAPPASVARWGSARVNFADVPPGHLAYPAASLAVASGVMATAPGDVFDPGRPVSGTEAVAVLDRLETLASVPVVRDQGR